MIIDAHTHIGRVQKREFRARELLDRMDAGAVDSAIVFSFPENIDNDMVRAAAAASPDRLIPVAMVNPWRDDAAEELERRLDEGFRGLKLHPVRHGFPLDREELTAPLIALAENYSVPVLAFGGQDYFSTPDRFEVLARRHPFVSFVMAHMGYPNERDGAARALRSCPNIYVETSGVQVRRYVESVVAVSESRVIFGSNTPHEDVAESLRLVENAIEDETVRRLVLAENTSRLFGL